MTLDEFFSGFEESRRLFDSLRAAIEALGAAEIRVIKSQIAFRRWQVPPCSRSGSRAGGR